MNLLTISDGFGDSVAVPAWYPKYFKWPEIIKLMTKGINLNNCSRYGAGNEFIVNKLKENIGSADKIIIQWAKPDRLDLMLTGSGSHWKDIIASDPVYKDNIVDCNNNKFWISSDSKTSAVREYHQKYISLKQHQTRSQILVEYAKLLIESQNIDYRFMLVENSDYLNVDAKWIYHKPWHGMSSFKFASKYLELELGIVQPLPLVAFDYIKQYIMPDLDLNWRSARDIDAVENMLYRHYQEAVKTRNDKI